MSLTLSFESEGVLAEQKQFAHLDGLVATALQQKLPLVLDLGSKLVTVGTIVNRGNRNDAVLRGQRISAELSIGKPGFRTGVCLPLLVEIQQIELPAGAFATFGRPHRPLGDFFLRNFFHAALQRKVRFDTTRATAPDLSRDLQRCYIWMLRTQFQDTLLQVTDPTEKLLMACHFGIDLGASPFFGKAAEEIRQKRVKIAAKFSEFPDLAQLMRLRSQMLAEF